MSRRQPLEVIAVVLLGLAVALLALEGGLRLIGFVFTQRQEWANQAALAEGRDIRVICIGESTTAMGATFAYPRQLESVLEERHPGPSFSVFNLGRMGAESSILLEDLESQLDRYRPHVVVAMMGANDVIGTAQTGPVQPRERAIPDLGVPLAERSGPATWLKTWRLVELLGHQVGKEPAAESDAPPRAGAGPLRLLLESVAEGVSRALR